MWSIPAVWICNGLTQNWHLRSEVDHRFNYLLCRLLYYLHLWLMTYIFAFDWKWNTSEYFTAPYAHLHSSCLVTHALKFMYVEQWCCEPQYLLGQSAFQAILDFIRHLESDLARTGISWYSIIWSMDTMIRDYFVYVLSQWETTLHCAQLSLAGHIHRMIPTWHSLIRQLQANFPDKILTIEIASLKHDLCRAAWICNCLMHLFIMSYLTKL